MQNIVYNIDRVNRWIGHVFGWTVLILTLFVTYEVFSRYAFGNPRPWAFDVMNMLYGTLFMMAGAYALATDAHVRGTSFTASFPFAYKQAWIYCCILCFTFLALLLLSGQDIFLLESLSSSGSTPILRLMARPSILLK